MKRALLFQNCSTLGEIFGQIKHYDYRQRYNGSRPHFHHLLLIGTLYSPGTVALGDPGQSRSVSWA